MTIRDAHYAYVARLKIRDAAMAMALAGCTDEVIRESMRDLAEEEAARAIGWAREEDERQAAADRKETGT